MPDPSPQFFNSPAQFRKWLEKHHARRESLWVGFHKKASGRGGITYRAAVDAALAYGWIDGIRKSIDTVSYRIRFTPRKAGSIWSQINLRRVRELESLGLMAASGLKEFRARDKRKQKLYSFENRNRGLDPGYQKIFKQKGPAWTFYQKQPPWYRRTTSWWVISAKQEETRLRRLGILIEVSGKGQWIEGLRRPGKPAR